MVIDCHWMVGWGAHRGKFPNRWSPPFPPPPHKKKSRPALCVAPSYLPNRWVLNISKKERERERKRGGKGRRVNSFLYLRIKTYGGIPVPTADIFLSKLTPAPKRYKPTHNKQLCTRPFPPRLAYQKPVLKTFYVAPNSFFKISKERVRSDLRRLKNRLQDTRSERVN